MPRSPLTKDLIDDPTLWRLSLMVSDKAVDVLAHRIVGEASIVSARLNFDPAATSQAAAIEEVIYANPMLLQPFDKIDLAMATENFLIVPPEVAGNQESIEALAKIFKPGDGQFVPFTSDIDNRNSIVFLLDKGVANFIGRTYDSSVPIHPLSALGRYFSHKSRLGNSSKMFVELGHESMNVLVYDHLGLAAANSFNVTDPNDTAYFILAVGRTSGLDPQEAEILLAGDADRRAALTPLLRRFVNYVMPAVFPSAAYHGDPQALKAPFPLIILPLCE